MSTSHTNGSVTAAVAVAVAVPAVPIPNAVPVDISEYYAVESPHKSLCQSILAVVQSEERINKLSNNHLVHEDQVKHNARLQSAKEMIAQWEIQGLVGVRGRVM